MGGVPVLMALAAMGIGYGWHPDGNGGVEYVIQISPEKLDHVEQVGEITSTVPPEVQGNVSRVVVRVGRQPLERQTPSSWDPARAAASSSPPAVGRRPGTRDDAPGEADFGRLSVAQSDHSPVPIPEIGKSPAAEASVMKPAPQNSAAPGFQFPGAVREAAAEALNQTRQGIDEAARRGQASVQRGIHSTIDEAGEALHRTADSAFAPGTASRITPTVAQGESAAPRSARGTDPADRRQQVPTFTGDDPGGRLAQASTRRRGPSTEPTDTQDDSWYNLDREDRRPQSSDPPSLQRGSSAQNQDSGAPTPAAGSGTRGAQGEAGRHPAPGNPPQSRGRASTSPEQNAEQPASGSASGHSGSTGDASSGAATSGTDHRTTDDARGQNSSEFGMPGNFGRMPRGLQAPASQPNSEPNGQRRVTSNRGGEEQSSDGRFAPENPPENSGGSGQRYTGSGEASGHTGGGYATGPGASPNGTAGTSSADPRLRAGEASALPPGGWSYDAHGRPVDREGYVLDQHGRRMAASGENPGDYRGRGAGNPPRGYREPSAGPASPDYPGRFASGGPAAQNSSQYDEPRRFSEADRRQRPSGGDRRYASAPPERGRSEAEPPTEPSPASSPPTHEPSGETASAHGGSRSQSDQVISEAHSGDRSGDHRSVAAQPLFNGLLLISFVANIYLAFWLKNLRHQFRELVAAKRVSTSHDPS